MLIPVLLFIVGLVLLIKGGDWFVDGATGLARRFHIPELLIGATVVSVGTTLPEVMVSATSALEGHGEIAYGNAIGPDDNAPAWTGGGKNTAGTGVFLFRRSSTLRGRCLHDGIL